MLLNGAGSSAGFAAEVQGLYKATVTVTSRDSERERQQGFSVAMRQMLIRLTGRQDTSGNPQISRALASPQPYVDTWAYRSLGTEVSPEGAPVEQIALEVSFFQTGIERLLNEAGIAIWPQLRPDTLLWIVIQDELGERFLVGTAEDPGSSDVLAPLIEFAELRGLPLLSPLMDFADLRALRPEQVWNFDIAALRSASQRYQSDSILALRIFRPLSGEIIGKAVYLFRDRVLEFDVLESSLAEFLDGSIDLAAEELSANYAVLLAGVDNNTEVLMTVDGVSRVDDYAGLLRYLQGLAVVSEVQVLGATDGQVQLQLRTGGQFSQLIDSIALDRRMTATTDVTRSGQQVLMYYQWRAN